ncbi:hypothetical protein J6E39_03125 [bacterium]|nr:hypothetical protein [bacterium]
MELENFVAQLEHPILALETINDVTYKKAEEDWNVLNANTGGKAAYLYAMLDVNMCIIRHIKYLLRKYNRIVDEEYQKGSENNESGD